MADSKITALTSIGASTDPANDPLVLVDVSDTSMAATGTTKKVTLNQLLGASGTATLASATITGDLTVDTSTLKVNSSANRVGVLTASPESDLDVRGLIAVRGTPTFPTTGVGLEAYYSISNTSTYLQSYDRSGGAFANLSYNALAHIFQTNGATAMTLNSTGLGVGGSPAEKLSVFSTSNTFGDARWNAGFNDLSSANTGTGGGVYFAGYTNGTSVAALFGSIKGIKENSTAGNTAGALVFTTLANGGTPTERLRIDSSGNVGIGVTPAGTGGCLQLKSGITFPATQVASSDANTLDDYEEGTFTPAIIGSTTAGTGTYVSQTGRYTKIGNQVTVWIYCYWTAHTGTGNMRVSGLPFNILNTSGFYPAASIGQLINISLTAGNVLLAWGNLNSNQIIFTQSPTGGGADSEVPIDTSGGISLTMTYTV